MKKSLLCLLGVVVLMALGCSTKVISEQEFRDKAKEYGFTIREDGYLEGYEGELPIAIKSNGCFAAFIVFESREAAKEALYEKVGPIARQCNIHALYKYEAGCGTHKMLGNSQETVVSLPWYHHASFFCSEHFIYASQLGDTLFLSINDQKCANDIRLLADEINY